MGCRGRKCSLASAVIENISWKSVRTKREAITLPFSGATASHHYGIFVRCLPFFWLLSLLLTSTFYYQICFQRKLTYSKFPMPWFSSHHDHLSQLLYPDLILYPDSTFLRRKLLLSHTVSVVHQYSHHKCLRMTSWAMYYFQGCSNYVLLSEPCELFLFFFFGQILLFNRSNNIIPISDFLNKHF